MPAPNSTRHAHLAEMFTWVNFCRVDRAGQADKVTPTEICTSCECAQDQQETSRSLCKELSTHGTPQRVVWWMQPMNVDLSMRGIIIYMGIFSFADGRRGDLGIRKKDLQ